jgi:hypothetical protein
MKNPWMVVPALLSLFITLPTYAQPVQLREKVMQSLDNVVRIEARFREPSQGFGYVVAVTPSNTFVLTARHVVAETIGAKYQQAGTIKVTTSDGTVLPVEGVRFLDEFVDIAILQLPHSSAILFKPNVLAPPPALNDEVWLFGYQQRLSFVGQSGRVRDIRSSSLFLSGAEGRPGSSGAPIFSASGLAAIYSGVNGAAGMSIPVGTIERLAVVAGIPWQLRLSEWVVASIRLTLQRKDGLKAPVIAVAVGGTQRYSLPGIYTVPAGAFTLDFDISQVLCVPATFTVRRSEPAQTMTVDCRPQFFGTWHGAFLEAATIDELQDGIFNFVATGPKDEPARWMRGRLLAKGTSLTNFQVDLTDQNGMPITGNAVLSDDLKTLTLQLEQGSRQITEKLRR